MTSAAPLTLAAFTALGCLVATFGIGFVLWYSFRDYRDAADLGDRTPRHNRRGLRARLPRLPLHWHRHHDKHDRHGLIAAAGTDTQRGPDEPTGNLDWRQVNELLSDGWGWDCQPWEDPRDAFAREAARR